VVVEDCDFVNTGTAAISVGGDDSVVRGCYFEATAPVSTGAGGQARRAIVVDGPGTNVEIDDCDVDWTGVASAPIEFTLPSTGGDGTISDLRVTDPGSGLLSAAWDVDRTWTGENINVTEV
jgi:hypothetical protein